VRIPLVVNGRSVCTYVVDFESTHDNGELEYVEIKGVRTRDWLLKWKLFDALQPETRKRVV
jgi:hypothetical protein